jgi:hypothetical protein
VEVALSTCCEENEIELRVSRRNKVLTTISPEAVYPHLYSMMAIARIFEDRGLAVVAEEGEEGVYYYGLLEDGGRGIDNQPRAWT